MGYENPRDRLELFLKKIIDKSTAPAERRTRFEQFLAGILDGSLVPDDPRNRLELYLKGVAESGGYIPPSGTITIASNGTHNVEQYKYASVAVTPVTESYSYTLGATGGQIINLLPTPGSSFNEVTLVRDDTIIKPENIKKNVTILGVIGTYDAGGGGTLLTDVRNITVGSTLQTVNLGWQPDMLVFSWVYYEYISEDPYYDQLHETLTGSGSVIPDNDTITFTSTGYTALLDGTAWNDNDVIPAGEVTVTAIKIS